MIKMNYLRISLLFTQYAIKKLFVHVADWIYTVGGYGGMGRGAKCSAERYNLLHDQWQPLANMNKSRYGHAVVSLNGKHALFAFTIV